MSQAVFADFGVVPPDPTPEAEPEPGPGGVTPLAPPLPGTRNPGEGCGVVAPNGHCTNLEDGPHIGFGRHKCERRDCPHCSDGWIDREAAEATARLMAGRWTQPDGIERRLVHAMFSPPPGSVASMAGLYEMRSDGKDLAKEHGIRGGEPMVHAYRVTDRVKQAFATAKTSEEGFDGGLWDYVYSDETGPWRSCVYWAPHVHIIGLCEDFEPGDDDADDGWVSVNLSTGHGVEPSPEIDRTFAPFTALSESEPFEDVARAVSYLLSHAVVEDNRRAVTWFGDLSHRTFQPDPEQAAERKTEPALGPLSAGAWAAIQRRSREAVGIVDREGEDTWECDCEGCEAPIRPFNWKTLDWIEDNLQSLSDADVARLKAAYEWRIGEDVPYTDRGDPPPSRGHWSREGPRTLTEAQEALAWMVEARAQMPPMPPGHGPSTVEYATGAAD